MEIKEVDFAEKNYVREVTKKSQIVLHHTVSGDGVEGDIERWNKQKSKIATHYIIDRQGIVYQLFDDDFWAYHLGTTKEHFKKFRLSYKNLNKTSIGIALDSLGAVLLHGASYYPVKWEFIKYVPDTEAHAIKNYPEEYCTNYKGMRYWERYTKKQLEALHELLKILTVKYEIPTAYKGDSFWIANKLALSGQSGIWGHCSFCSEKSAPHPQVELVKVLKSL